MAIIALIFEAPFLLLFLFYLTLIIFYIYRNIYKKRCSIYWVELTITTLAMTSGLFMLFLHLMLNDNTTVLSIIHTVMNIFLFVFLMGINNVIINTFKSILILISYIRNKNRNGGIRDGNKSLSQYIDLSKITNCVTNKPLHILLIVILLTMDGIILYFYNNTSEENIQILIRCVKDSLLICMYVISILNIIFLHKLKAHLELVLYNKDNTKHIYEFEFLVYKNLIDMILNTPHMICLSVAYADISLQILTVSIWFMYILFMTNLLLRHDKSNKIQIFKIMKHFSLHKTIIMGNPPRDMNKKKIIIDSYDDSYNNLNESSNIDYLINECGGNKNKDTAFSFYLPVNILILFKLLSNYYKINEKYINTYQKKVNDFSFDRVSSNSNNGNINMNIILSRISQVSSSSFTNMNNDMLFQYNNFFLNLEDNELKEHFDKFIKNKMRAEKIAEIPTPEFSIQAYFTETLLELLPFYQIYVKDIIASLDVGKNKNISRTLYEKKSADKTFNNFFTFDSFLYFEVYDKHDNTFNDLKSFCELYHNYLLNRIKNWKQTFLPLIIGIFNVKFFDYDKIVILYRHPYAFSPFQLFKFWMNICLSDTNEKLSISGSYSEILDMKEIEIKDNLNFHQDDYSEIEEITKSDFKFMKSLPFASNFSINIFIINDMKNFLSNQSHAPSKNMDELNLQSNNRHSRISHISHIHEKTTNNNSKEYFPDFITAMRKTDLFRESVIKSLGTYKRENGSVALCNLDKIITNYLNNTRYIIKFYFTDIFRMGSVNNTNTTTNTNVKEYNKAYCSK